MKIGPIRLLMASSYGLPLGFSHYKGSLLLRNFPRQWYHSRWLISRPSMFIGTLDQIKSLIDLCNCRVRFAITGRFTRRLMGERFVCIGWKWLEIRFKICWCRRISNLDWGGLAQCSRDSHMRERMLSRHVSGMKEKKSHIGCTELKEAMDNTSLRRIFPILKPV